MRVCIIGGSGMLGHRLFSDLGQSHDAWATVRKANDLIYALPNVERHRVIEGVDATDDESLMRAFAICRPEIVINCVGLIKQREEASLSLEAIRINSLLPHRLTLMCDAIGTRLIHFSTDCVFSGKRGMYSEDDVPDASDLYGRSKLLGEIDGQPHCLTIRTSLIGRELGTHFGLVEWFLAQQNAVRGFQHAIFSGFPTYIIAEILRDMVFPNPELCGLYHVSADPISKYDLLHLLKDAFRKDIEIIPDSTVVIDRSLNSDRFQSATRFVPGSWPQMVAGMATLLHH